MFSLGRTFCYVARPEQHFTREQMVSDTKRLNDQIFSAIDTMKMTRRKSRNFEISIVKNQEFDTFFREFQQIMSKIHIAHQMAVMKCWFSEIWVVSRSFWVKIFPPQKLSFSSGKSADCLPQRRQSSSSARASQLASWLLHVFSVCWQVCCWILRKSRWPLLTSRTMCQVVYGQNEDQLWDENSEKPIQYNRWWLLLSGTYQMFKPQDLKCYFEEVISPSTSSRDL